MAFQPTSKATPDSNEVIFFTQANYSGDTYSSIIGDSVNFVDDLKYLNDAFYSLRVGSAVQLTLYNAVNFSGTKQVVTTDIPVINTGVPGSGLSGFSVAVNQEYINIDNAYKAVVTFDARTCQVNNYFSNNAKEVQSPIIIHINYNDTSEGRADDYTMYLFSNKLIDETRVAASYMLVQAQVPPGKIAYYQFITSPTCEPKMLGGINGSVIKLDLSVSLQATSEQYNFSQLMFQIVASCKMESGGLNPFQK